MQHCTVYLLLLRVWRTINCIVTITDTFCSKIKRFHALQFLYYDFQHKDNIP
jgi:hypothetical protein